MERIHVFWKFMFLDPDGAAELETQAPISTTLWCQNKQVQSFFNSNN